jgi:hypothetical protein
LYKLELDPQKKYDSVCITQVSIPKSYYLIQANRNTFTLKEDSKEVEVAIPVGGYNAQTFATKLAALLCAASPNGLTYTVTAPKTTDAPSTGKYRYGVSSAGIEPSFIFGDDVYEQMGFGRGSTNTFSSYALTSVNVINMQLEDTLVIHSDLADNKQDDVIHTVYAGGTPDLSSIQHECDDIIANSRSLKSRSGNVYRFAISDEFGRPIDLNGRNCVFTLLIYEKDTTLQTLFSSFSSLLTTFLESFKPNNSSII